LLHLQEERISEAFDALRVMLGEIPNESSLAKKARAAGTTNAKSQWA